MMRKLYKSQKGQISTEIMYAVGVMILIFLLLSGISFNRRSELQKVDDHLQKRSECLKIANTLASLTASGFNSRAVLTLSNPVWIYPNGRIVIAPSTTSTTETSCTYVGNINSLQLGSNDHLALTGGGINYCFFNNDEIVSIFEKESHLCFTLCSSNDPLVFVQGPAVCKFLGVSA